MTAYVKSASRKKPAVPRWNGGRMPLSSELSHALKLLRSTLPPMIVYATFAERRHTHLPR